MQYIHALSIIISYKSVIRIFFLTLIVIVLLILITSHAYCLSFDTFINHADRLQNKKIHSENIAKTQSYQSLFTINFGLIGTHHQQTHYLHHNECFTYACTHIGLNFKINLPPNIF
jgi:hypothetical protein